MFLCSQHVTLLCVSHTLFAHSCVHILRDKCNLLASHSHLFSSIRDKEFGLKLGSGFRFDNESILKQGAASVARQEWLSGIVMHAFGLEHCPSLGEHQLFSVTPVCLGLAEVDRHNTVCVCGWINFNFKFFIPINHSCCFVFALYTYFTQLNFQIKIIFVNFNKNVFTLHSKLIIRNKLFRFSIRAGQYDLNTKFQLIKKFKFQLIEHWTIILFVCLLIYLLTRFVL